ncbi:MAG: PilT/PilU family type 4a pilus ATPase [Candidatus Coatesbacteria bacterium]
MEDSQLDAILREAVSRKASDIHVKTGVPAYVRIHGSLSRYDDTVMTREAVDQMVLQLLDGDAEGRMKTRGEIDIAHTIAGVARFRCNIFRQRGSLEIIMRVVPYRIPTLEELGLPPALKHIALEARGLVLVTGITGSGKSTTVASMVQHLNESLPVHVVTIEDPIEFVYRDDKASISQREVGIDTESFHSALRFVLRQDPDVIVLGEMRDRETASTAITAAETGHLVFSTLHTADAVQTIDRVIDLFPPEQQDQMRHQMSVVMKGTISMRLLPRIDGKGLAPAVEVMINTPAIKALIEENKLSEIRSHIAEGASQYGMQTFDQSILALYKSGVITKEVALDEATSPAELELAMRGITSGTASASSFIKRGEDNYYQQKSKDFYARARRLFSQDLVEDALREVRRALVDWPDYPDAKALLGEIEERMKRTKDKGAVEPFIKKGLELVTQDRIEEALAVFNQGLAQDPGNEKLLTMKKAAEEKGARVRGIKPLMEKAVGLLTQGQWAEAKTALNEVLEKDPGNSEALDRFSELLVAQGRQQMTAEIDELAVRAEAAQGEKRWFEAVALWNLVREIQPDHQKAMTRVAEAGAQIKMMGVPGLTGGQPWTASVIQMFERGLGQFLGGQTLACLAEWRQVGVRVPQAADLLATNIQKVEALHAEHVSYHTDRAKALYEQGDLGRALAQLRHALQVDPQAGEARSLWEVQSSLGESAVKRFLSDAAQWETMDRMRAALFCIERAYEIDPTREGLKNRVADTRARLAKLREIHAAMDRK